MTYDLEEIVKDVESVEEELDENYHLTIRKSMVEQRHEDSSNSFKEHIRQVEVSAAHVTASFYEEEISVSKPRLNKDILIEKDKKLLEYAEALE